MFCPQVFFKYKETYIFLNVYHTNKDDQEARDTDIMSAKRGQDLLTSLKIKD